MAFEARSVKRCEASVIFLLDVCTPREKVLDNLWLSGFSGDVKSGIRPLVGSIEVRPGGNEESH